MPMTRRAPAPEPARGDPLPLPATGLPESVPAPPGRDQRHEISATTRLWELHPSEQPSATARLLSTRREPARWGAYIPVPLCNPACILTRRVRAPNSRRDAACRVLSRIRIEGNPCVYRMESRPSRASNSLVRPCNMHFLAFLE